jgi:hypothetical protein
MATELTVKERAFAHLIIEGTKVAAYRKIYSDRGSPATTAVAAYKLSKKPKIKAEVARLLRQRECPPDDYARIREVVTAGLMEAFLREPDPKVRLKAGTILLAYADAGLKLHPEPSTKERAYDELTQFLGNIVREHRTATDHQEPLIVETDPPVVLPVPEARFDEALGNADEEAVAELSVWDDAAEMHVPVGSGSEGTAPEAKFEKRPVPGAFPVRLRRVRVP